MRRLSAIVVVCGVLLGARQAGAVCKMIINVDRTASMNSLRADGLSKCFVAQNAVLLMLDAYWHGLDFDITMPGMGVVSRPEIDASCPAGADFTATAGTRLVQVREFLGDTMQPLWSGFIPVDQAYQQIVTSSGWFNASGVSTGSCPGGSTPMAQAMCRAAWEFPAGLPPAGEFRIAKTNTDGQENWSDVVPIAVGETRCRLPGDTETTWRNRVMGEYTSRGIAADAILWTVGGGTTLLPTIAARESAAEARGEVAGNAAPITSAVVVPPVIPPIVLPDFNFFTNMAASTGGRFRFITETTAISSAVTLTDGDGDGIPDFRDQCPSGACASDSDNDGVPNASDPCPFLAEDGNSPARADGCPDTDSDGVRNGIDQCPLTAEDRLAPFPGDGCPAAHWTASATPNLATIDNGSACTSMNVTSTSGAAQLAKLTIAGSHAYRAVLRGTLTHNGVTVAAFPVNTFPAGFGSFSLTNRPIAMPPGAASGAWTLCIVDTDGFGDTGVLNSWSIHD